MKNSNSSPILRFINVAQDTSKMIYLAEMSKNLQRVWTRNIILALALSGLSVSFSVSAESPTLTSHVIQTTTTQKNIKTADKDLLADIKPKRANFKQESASQDALYLADWIIDSNNNERMPFVIVDKKQAKVFVFDAYGQLNGAAPALLGLAVGDTSIPDIGNMALSSIKPEQRTTPAGRFVASLGKNLHDKEILWVDYDGAISLHRVVTSSPKERRLQRLESKNPLERRISYGCINVPVNFYDQVVSTAFNNTSGIVYVMPDTLFIKDLFGSYEVKNTAQSTLE